MRTALAVVLALLALAPACSEEPPGQTPDDRPRGERCDDMQMCGRTECAAEIQALADCIGTECNDVGSTEREEIEIALAECLEASGCNTTSCDVVVLQTAEAADACEDPSDGDLYIAAKAAMLTPDRIPECQGLE